MQKTIILFFLYIILSNCGQNPAEHVDTPKIFRTTAPSLLFFKNMRSIHYENVSDSEDTHDLFRLRNLSFSDNQPTIYLTIGNYWLEDKAYLYINLYPKQERHVFQIGWKNETNQGIIPLESTEQLQAASEIIQRLKNKDQIILIDGEGKETPILTQKTARRSFYTVYNDYMRLTENLK